MFHHGDSAVSVAAPSRAKAVPEAFLGDVRPDCRLSDRHGGQTGFAGKQNQVCLAHLRRDLQFAADQGETVLAPGLVKPIGRACRIGRRRGRLGDATLKACAARLERDLDAILAHEPTGKPGRELKRMLRKIRRHLFVFVTNRAAEPANNGSERALRRSRDIPESHQRLPQPVGRQTLRRHSLHPRNRPPPRHQRPRRHPPHPAKPNPGWASLRE